MPELPMEMSGQEQEKSEIAQIKEMVNKIAAMCDSLMQREEQEDKTEQPKNPTIEQSNLSEKANFVRNYPKK